MCSRFFVAVDRGSRQDEKQTLQADFQQEREQLLATLTAENVCAHLFPSLPPPPFPASLCALGFATSWPQLVALPPDDLSIVRARL